MKKVLLIKFSALGDVLAFTPVIQCLASSRSYEIYHWVMDDCKVVTECNPNVYKQFSFIYHKKSKFKTLYSLLRVLLEIRKSNFDYIFLFHRSLTLKLISLLINSKYRYGFKVNFFSDFFYTENIDYDIYKNRSDQYIDLVKKSNISSSSYTNYKINFFMPDIKFDSIKLPFDDYLVINPGGGNIISDAENRLWPIDNYVGLIDSLIFNIVLVGKGGNDFARSDYIIQHSKNRNVINLVGLTNFYETAYIIKKSKLYIGNDSGLIFLSTALGVSNVGLYGPTPISSAVPIGNKTYFIESKYSCAPCYNPKDGLNGAMYKCKKNLCMYHISVGDVLNKISFALKSNEI